MSVGLDIQGFGLDQFAQYDISCMQTAGTAPITPNIRMLGQESARIIRTKASCPSVLAALEAGHASSARGLGEEV